MYLSSGRRPHRPATPIPGLPARHSARRALWAAAVGLILTALACALPGSDPGQGAELATAVSATLAAATIVAPEGESPDSQPTESAVAPSSSSVPADTQGELSLVYTSGGDAWLLEGEAPARQITSMGGVYQVVISSDGQRIVFARRGRVDLPSEIWGVNRDGSAQSQLVASTRWNELYDPEGFLFNDLAGIDFIPGTHALLLGTQAVPEGPGVFRYDDLLRLDADTGTLTTLLTPGQGGAFTLSPDGGTAAIVRPTSIGLVNSDGTGLRPDLVTFPMVITYSEYQWYPKLTWSPDSRAVGAAIPSADPLAADPSGTVWRVDRESAVATAGPAISGNFFFPQFGAAALAPDLGRVAFARSGATPNTTDLFLANADGSAEGPYVSGDVGWKGWSPDSQHFVFSQDSPADLMLGSPAVASEPLASGHTLQWIGPTEFVLLSGGQGSWTLARGSIGGPLVPLASPTGDFVAFDTTTG